MQGWTSASESLSAPWASEDEATRVRTVKLEAELAVAHVQRRIQGDHDGVASESVETRVRRLISLATCADTLSVLPARLQSWL